MVRGLQSYTSNLATQTYCKTSLDENVLHLHSSEKMICLSRQWPSHSETWAAVLARRNAKMILSYGKGVNYKCREEMLWVGLPHFNHHTVTMKSIFVHSIHFKVKADSSQLGRANSRCPLHIVSSFINVFVSVQFCWLRSCGVYRSLVR